MGYALVVLLFAIWITDVGRYAGEIRFEDFELMAALEATLRFFGFYVITWEIGLPLACRVHVLEQIK